MEKRQKVKKKLDDELRTIQFTKQKEVLQKLHTLTWREKLITFWNKEIAVPLIPIVGITVLLLFTISIQDIISDVPFVQKEEKVLIEVEGYVYWKDELEKSVLNDES